MKIVHISPGMPYNEGWSYQENLLPKYQARLGNDVTLLVTNFEQKMGRIVETGCFDYMSSGEFRVIRCKTETPMIPKIGKFFSKLVVYEQLKMIKPDFIFYHSLVNATIFQVSKYKRKINKNVVIVQDNHLDYNIGFSPNANVKSKLVCMIYRMFYKLNNHNISKVYGVTPWRKQYAEEVFRVPPKKTDVLIMGADDDKINFSEKKEIRTRIRGNLLIKENDFLVLTGGKIDKNKKIDLLIRACSDISNVKLLIFGSLLDDIKAEVETLIAQNSNVINIGWIEAEKFYDYCFAADLVFFPGQHSVLWEQACAAKVPCVFSKWEGMEHVNNGGNNCFVFPVTVDTIREKILELKFSTKYYDMKRVAESEKTDIFLYSNIAKKSLECSRKE